MKTIRSYVRTSFRTSVIVLILASLFLVPKPTFATGELVHVVQPGDNLSTIAARYETTVTILTQHNKISDADFIWVGQLINIPDKVHNTRTEIQSTTMYSTNIRKAARNEAVHFQKVR